MYPYKLIFSVILLFNSQVVLADTKLSLGVGTLDSEVVFKKVALSSFDIGLGYEFELSDSFAFVTMISYGSGINSKSFSDETSLSVINFDIDSASNVEIDKLLEVSLLLDYKIDKNYSFFAKLSYLDINTVIINSERMITLVSNDNFGFGSGVKYSISDVPLEFRLSASKYTDDTYISLKAIYTFNN